MTQKTQLKIFDNTMRSVLARFFSVITAVVAFVTAAVIPVSAESSVKLPDNEAMRFVDAMGAGWNLGNEFDAADCTWISNKLDYETAWSHAKTTRELIATVKKAGFSTIRIPVSWHDHVDSSFNIDKDWLARVKEVVDWCVDEDLYIVLNTHHDIKKGFIYPSKDQLKESEKYIVKIWEQLCSTFGNYSEKLIFEAMNEPRLAGTNYEWWFNTSAVPAEAKESLECVNQLNQAFVDTVRASGKKNGTRYLLVGGYATSDSDIGILSGYFRMPADKVKNRLIADVHYYCSNLKFNKNGFKKIYDAFSAKGVPVIVSEFGLRKDYEEGYSLHDKEDVSAKKLGEIVACARGYGFSCIFWDNNSGSAGKIGFKIIDRTTAKVELPKIVDAIVKNGAPAFASTVQSAASPSVKSSLSGNKLTLSWNKVEGASKYAVYVLKNGKYTKLKTLSGTKLTVSGLVSGKTYKYAVRAYVGGKWSAVTSACTVSVKVK